MRRTSRGGEQSSRHTGHRYVNIQERMHSMTTSGRSAHRTARLESAGEALSTRSRSLHLRQLFADDPQRGEQLTAEAVGIYLDYSKNRVTDRDACGCWCNWPRNRAWPSGSRPCSRGEKINVTEKRAVLHVALRAPRGESIVVDGQNVVPEVHAVLDKMAAFSRPRPRSAQWKGHTGKRIKQRRQHRHRRLRPGAGDGLRGAAPLQPARHDVPLRVERRRHRHRRGHARSRSGRNAVHRRVEDVHHAGNADQRPLGPRLAA